MNDTDLVEAVRGIVLSILGSKDTTIRDGWLYAQWWGADPSDASGQLSQVRLANGNILRGIPRASDITSFTLGEQVLLAIPRSGPACIVCRVFGNAGSFTL